MSCHQEAYQVLASLGKEKEVIRQYHMFQESGAFCTPSHSNMDVEFTTCWAIRNMVPNRPWNPRPLSGSVGDVHRDLGQS